MTKQCTQCNSALTTQSKFCPNCGAAVPEETPATAQAQSYTPPPAQGSYTPPAQQSRTPPAQTGQGNYTPPQQSYTPPPGQQAYTPPAQGHTPPVQQQGGYVPPQGYAPPQQPYGAQPAYGAPQKQKNPLNPKLLLFGGIGVVVILVIVLLASLLGGNDKPAAADDPYLGVWEAVFLIDEEGDTYTAEEIFDDGLTLELMEKGKCIMIFDGDRETLKWSVKDGHITIKEGSDLFFKGTIKDGKIVAEDFPDTDNTMTFVKQGYVAANGSPQGGKADGGAAEGGPTETQTKWYGTWVGYMWVTEAYGSWADFEDDLYRADMVVKMDETGAGTMGIWIYPDPENDPDGNKVVDSYIRADTNHFEVTEGEFWDMSLDPSTWWLAISPINKWNTANLIVLTDVYQEPGSTDNDGFEFIFNFRPWGELWEDEIGNNDKLPPGYEDYVSALENGLIDPDGWAVDFGGAAVAPAPIKPSAPAATTAPAPQAAEPQRLPAAKLREAYDAMDPSGMTYEEVRDMYLAGVDGEPQARDNPDLRAYVWRAVEADYQTMYVSFKKNAAGKYVYTSRSISNIPKPE